MAGGEFLQHNPEELKTQNDPLSHIRENFGEAGIEDFESFIQEDLFGIKNKNLIYDIFVQNSSNEEFHDYIIRNNLPYDAEGGEDFLTKFKSSIPTLIEANISVENHIQATVEKKETAESDVKATVEKKETTESDIQTAEKESEILKEKSGKFLSILRGNPKYSSLGIPDINASFDEQQKFINENYEAILQIASEQSNTEYVKVYETLQSFQGVEGYNVPNFQTENSTWYQKYTDAKLAIDPSYPNIGPKDVKTARIALGDSSISKIEGDRVYGENGEVIDVSKNIPTLSLAGKDGMTLEVGSIETPDTRKTEQEIAGLEIAIQDLEGKVEKNEGIMQKFVVSANPENLKTEEQTTPYFTSLLQTGLSPKFVEQIDDTDIFGTALLQKVGEYINSENTNLKSDIAMFEKQVGILKSRSETQNMLASEKIKIQKERVKSSQNLLERMGVPSAVTSLQEIFPLISPQNPVVLSNGDIITGINLSTMEFEGSFTPSLGETGAKDPRTQAVLAELLNRALFGTPSEPIKIGGTGNIYFAQNAETQKVSQSTDTSSIKREIQAIIGEITFSSQAKKNLGLIS